MTGKQDYIVKSDGWMAGRWHAAGSIVALTEREAKYENVERALDASKAAGASVETNVPEPNPTKRRRGRK